jgi:hypothetical protein
MNMRVLFAAIGLVGFGAVASTSQAALFQPDSATASTQWSASYDIGNTIDGSGLEVNFTPVSVHATYVQNNHWTTADGNTVGSFADFYFNAPVTIGTFHMWNHLSNGVASNDDYAVTQFDLLFFDDQNNLLFQLLDQSALAHVHIAQSYVFAPVDNVSRVHFLVDETMQELQTPRNGTDITGLAEVAFESIPEPASALLLVAGAALILRRRNG